MDLQSALMRLVCQRGGIKQILGFNPTGQTDNSKHDFAINPKSERNKKGKMEENDLCCLCKRVCGCVRIVG